MPALTVSAGDTRLHVVDTPGGPPPLVLVNGAFGTTRNWNRVTAGLAGRHRVIRFDARGRLGATAQFRLHRIEFAQDCVGAFEECLAAVRERHPSRMARQKLRIERSLEIGDAAAERRLRYVQSLCGAFEAARRSNLGEISNLSNIHVVLRYVVSTSQIAKKAFVAPACLH